MTQSHEGKECCRPSAQAYWWRNVRGNGVGPAEQQIAAGNQIQCCHYCTTLCDVVEARWVPLPQTMSGFDAPQSTDWVFIIKANRFLRNMVRAVVGTLVEVGRHRMTPAQFREVIEGRSRSNAGDSMPANALFLQKIEYSESSHQTEIRK